MCQCHNLRLGEVEGSYSILVRKFNGMISKNGEDENFLRGLFWLFEYVLCSAISQKPIEDSESEKCFRAFSTKNYLGPGYNDLELTIKEREKELFFLKKTENQLKILQKGMLELDVAYLHKVFKVLRSDFQKDFLVDPKQGFIMISPGEIRSIHVMSINVSSNGTDVFHVSF